MARLRWAAIQHHNFVINLLEHRGSLINPEKSDLAPSQVFTSLGFIWDAQALSEALLSEKMRNYSVHWRELQCFLGCTNFVVISVSQARLNTLTLQGYLSAVSPFQVLPTVRWSLTGSKMVNRTSFDFQRNFLPQSCGGNIDWCLQAGVGVLLGSESVSSRWPHG